MPEPDDDRGALKRLDERLDAFEAERRKPPSMLGAGKEAGEGYRLLAQMLGGVLGGLGFGWLVDRLAHTAPWGVVVGLVIGAFLSIFSTVQTASRISARAAAAEKSLPRAPEDEDD